MRIVIAGRPFSAARALLRFLAYFGIGALLHAVFHDPVLDPASAWTWAYLLAWPVLVVLSLFKWGAVAVGWLIVACMAVKAWSLIGSRRRKDGIILALIAALAAILLAI